MDKVQQLRDQSWKMALYGYKRALPILQCSFAFARRSSLGIRIGLINPPGRPTVDHVAVERDLHVVAELVFFTMQ